MARGYWRVQRYQVFYGDGSSIYASTEKQAVKLAKKYDGRAIECDGSRQIYPAAEHRVQSDECQASSDKQHEFYQGSTWRICAHCGTRR